MYLLTITRLTSDTAFSSIFNTYMAPNMSSTVIAIVNVRIEAIKKLKPKRSVVTQNMARSEMLRLNAASFQIVKYCS